MKRLILMITTIAMLTLSGCNNKSEEPIEISWLLGTSSPENTVTQIFAESFKEELKALSNGTIELKIYPNSVIGGDKELLEDCIFGDIPFVIQNTAPQSSYIKEAAVFDLPSAYSSIEDLRKSIDNEAFMERIRLGYSKAGIRLLSLSDQGFRVMSSNKPIGTLEDFKGQKIRTMENTNHIAYWKTIGANPTPMAFSEVYIGLQQNTIDAQENPYEVIVSSKFYEQQRYIIETNHLPHIITLIVNEEFYKGLSSEERDIVEEAARRAQVYSREQSDLRIEERISFLKDKGVNIIALSEELHNSIYEVALPLYEVIEEKVGSDLVNLYINNR